LPHASAVSECDAILYPYNAKATTAARTRLARYALAARKAKRPLIAFAVVDSVSAIAVPGTIVFRTSMDRSKSRHNEFLLPYLWETYDRQVEYKVRDWDPEPTIGFCGLADDRRRPWLDRLSHDMRCNFIVRPAFWGGNPHDPQLIREFFTNIMDTDMTFAMRGYGNFSMRFYQVMSCGRVPIWVDTDSVLPYEGLEEIPWSRISIRLEAGAYSTARAAIHHFWDSVGDFGALQDDIRSLHERLFTPGAFARHLTTHWDSYLARAHRT